MRTSRDGGPAFPRTEEGTEGGQWTYHGMSIRDYFAAAAVQALIADPECTSPATTAYVYAQQMVDERAKRIAEDGK